MRHLGFAAAAALALAACDSEERTTAEVAPGETAVPATPPLATPVAEPPTAGEQAEATGDLLGAASIAALSVSPAAPGEPIDLSAEIDRLERERREALGLDPGAAEFAAADLGAAAGAGAGALDAGAPPAASGSGPEGPADSAPQGGQQVAQAEGRPGEDAPEQTPLSEGARATESETAIEAVSESGGPEVRADGLRQDAEGRISQTAGENALPTTEMSVDSETAEGLAEVNPEATPEGQPSTEAEDGLLPRAGEAETVDTRPPAATGAFVNSEGTFGTETSGRKAEGQMDAQRRAVAESGGPGGLMSPQGESGEASAVPTTPLTLAPGASGDPAGAAGEPAANAGQDAQVAMDPAAGPGAVGRLDAPTQQMGERETPGEAVASGGDASGGESAGGELADPLREALLSLQAINERLNEFEGEAAGSEAVREMRDELQTAAEALIRAAGRAGVPLDQLAQQ